MSEKRIYYGGTINGHCATLEVVATFDAILTGCFVADAIVRAGNGRLTLWNVGCCGDTMDECLARFDDFATAIGFRKVVEIPTATPEPTQ